MNRRAGTRAAYAYPGEHTVLYFIRPSPVVLDMTRKFTLVAVFVIVIASVAGGVRSRAFRRHPVNANSGPASGEKYEADKIETDYREAINTVEERYAGEIDYEKA